nr:hypothetical protein [uncultured Campylobacter sp.]
MKISLRFLSLALLFLFAPLFALDQDEAVKVCEQIDAGLDQILDFLRQNPHRLNDELGEYCDRLFTPFVFNAKMYNTDKIDFVRIKKALKFEKQILD